LNIKKAVESAASPALLQKNPLFSGNVFDGLIIFEVGVPSDEAVESLLLGAVQSVEDDSLFPLGDGTEGEFVDEFVIIHHAKMDILHVNAAVGKQHIEFVGLLELSVADKVLEREPPHADIDNLAELFLRFRSYDGKGDILDIKPLMFSTFLVQFVSIHLLLHNLTPVTFLEAIIAP
jgi:hypothetical protein